MVLSCTRSPGFLKPRVEVDFLRMNLPHAVMADPGLVHFRIQQQ